MTGRSVSAWRGRIGGVLLVVAGTMVPGWPARPSDHHMWNVQAPLDIAFAKADGRIVSILRMEPGARTAHGPMAWFRYAIEARGGYFKERGIAVGHVVRLELRG